MKQKHVAGLFFLLLGCWITYVGLTGIITGGPSSYLVFVGLPLALHSITLLRGKGWVRVPHPVITMIMGIVVLSAGVYFAWRQIHYMRFGIPTLGIIIRDNIRAGGRGSTYMPIVQFTSNDKSYVFQDSIGSFQPHTIGKSVPVLFDPVDPNDAIINRKDFQAPGFLLVFGSFLFLTAAMSHRKRKCIAAVGVK